MMTKEKLRDYISACLAELGVESAKREGRTILMWSRSGLAVDLASKLCERLPEFNKLGTVSAIDVEPNDGVLWEVVSAPCKQDGNYPVAGDRGFVVEDQELFRNWFFCQRTRKLYSLSLDGIYMRLMSVREQKGESQWLN